MRGGARFSGASEDRNPGERHGLLPWGVLAVEGEAVGCDGCVLQPNQRGVFIVAEPNVDHHVYTLHLLTKSAHIDLK